MRWLFVQCHEPNTCDVTADGADEIRKKKEKERKKVNKNIGQVFVIIYSSFSKCISLNATKLWTTAQHQKHERKKKSNIAKIANSDLSVIIIRDSYGVNSLADPLTVCWCNGIIHPIARFYYDLMKVNKNTNSSLTAAQSRWLGGAVNNTIPSQQEGSGLEPTQQSGPVWSLHVLPRDCIGSLQVLGHP